MSERKRRIAENEAIFRNVNEQIRDVTKTLLTHTDEIQIVCECGTHSCTDRIPILVTEYERIRDNAILFFVKPGHDFPETETVVSKRERYWVLRKDPGMPADFARATQPSSNN
jgi:hypothetical protein